MRFSHVIAAAALMLLGAAAAAHAEKRIALVVGNAAYSHADRLADPVKDAQGMRDVLKTLGFDVIYGEDLDLKALGRAIGQFADRVGGADVAMVYFAGHGVTFGDTPYVVPVDAEFTSLGQATHELVSVETLIGDLRQAKGVRIAILDACRDNAAEQELKRQASRGGAVSRGLAPMKNPGGLIIAYATQYLSTAADDAGTGTAGHSPFTAALLDNITTPGLDVKEMFYKVGREVAAATGGKQRPEISVSMFEQYALAPAAAEPRPPGSAQSPPPASAVAEAAQAWAAVQNSTSLVVLDDFLRHYGDAPVYGALARDRRETLAKHQAKAPDKEPAKPSVSPQTAKEPAGKQTAAVASPAKPDGPAADSYKPRDSFRDCDKCPEMVVLPAGRFMMGTEYAAIGDNRTRDDIPHHVVTISKPFAVGKFHVTVDQFAAFAKETGYTARPGCDWSKPGFPQEGTHPVVCVSWTDAKGYADWLAKKTGKPYRLLSEAEWEYAERGLSLTGAGAVACRYANFKDDFVPFGGKRECNDEYSYTSPAGHYEPNAFGLYDMLGNAWQWTEDCYNGSYDGAPADGSAWTSGSCGSHVVRGGSWFSSLRDLSGTRRSKESFEDGNTGFLVGRTLAP